ncbi:hypothetical protein POUND7_020114 [Theobroma cacao]
MCKIASILEDRTSAKYGFRNGQGFAVSQVKSFPFLFPHYKVKFLSSIISV